MGAYPTKDMEAQAAGAAGRSEGGAAAAGARSRSDEPPVARIVAVEPESPADDAGFEPGCLITSVDGAPLRDIIDWRWLSADDEIEVGYVDLDGDAGTVVLEREEGQSWGFTFDGVVFDRVKLCRNACTFCFMRQLPRGMRASLSMRDDDFRLSFLSGTFVTLTNLTSEDEARIVEQRISPLRVSLHAHDPQARRALIGRHAAHGIEALDRLLAAGIQFHAQIVLVPGENDGEVLADTLAWAYERPGILGIGIVPLGFTRYQTAFDRSFDDPADARAVLDLVRPFQERALAERGEPWVHAADEFYCNAFGAAVIEHVPPASWYGDFSMFEDGIGIVRSYIDEFREACTPQAGAESLAGRVARMLDAAGVRVRFVVGEAMQPFLDRLIVESPLAGRIVPLTVRNDFFGGNVDVTGLLCGCDMARAIRAAAGTGVSEDEGSDSRRVGGETAQSLRQSCSHESAAGAFGSCGTRLVSSPAADVPAEDSSRGLSAIPAEHRISAAADGIVDLFVIPRVVLNDDLRTLDDMTVGDVENAAGARVSVVSCNPLDYLQDIADLVAGSGIA